MKTLILSLVLFFSNSSFADQVICEPLSDVDFLQELVGLSQEHREMTIEQIHADYKMGVDFIRATFGEDSKQYKSALVFVSDTATMDTNEIEITEDLRIQIIPLLTPESIYKEHRELLMRNCRDVLLAAMILT